jgi:hypothetical protein
MPQSNQQERWEVYAPTGTKVLVRQWLEPRETLSEFFRTALEHELARREKKWKAA